MPRLRCGSTSPIHQPEANRSSSRGGLLRGVSLTLNNDVVKFNVDGDGSLLTLSDTVGTGWHQAVGVIDLVGTSDDLVERFHVVVRRQHVGRYL